MAPSIDMAGTAFSADDVTALGEAVDRLLSRAGRAPRVLGFGEPMHGEEEFLGVRNRLFRYLVEHAGYRSIALESGCLRGRIVDGYIKDGLGDLDKVMPRGFSHGFGDSPANRELVEWMATYKRTRPVDQRLRFLGFDAPMEMSGAESPREALSILWAYLLERSDAPDLPVSWDRIAVLLGEDDRWSDPAAAMDPSRSIGASAEVGQLRLITDDLRWLLAGDVPQLARGSADELWDAELAARTAAGLLGSLNNSVRRTWANRSRRSASNLPSRSHTHSASATDHAPADDSGAVGRGCALVVLEHADQVALGVPGVR